MISIEMCICAGICHINIHLADPSQYPSFSWSHLKQTGTVPSGAGRTQNNFLPLSLWVPKHHKPDRFLWVQQCITNQLADSFPWWNQINNLVQVCSGHLCRYLALYGNLVYFLHVTPLKIFIRIMHVKVGY